jgi:hypothetical protein
MMSKIIERQVIWWPGKELNPMPAFFRADFNSDSNYLDVPPGAASNWKSPEVKPTAGKFCQLSSWPYNRGFRMPKIGDTGV